MWKKSSSLDVPSRTQFFQALSALPSDMREAIGCAYAFSETGHASQTRDSGEPYFIHPLMVGWILIKELDMANDWEAIVDALLHDIKEDTPLLSHRRIALNFSLSVAYDLEALTHPKNEPIDQYIERLTRRGIRVLLVKLADRLHNMRTLHFCPEEKRQRKAEETCDFFFPLCDTLRVNLPQAEKWRAGYLKKELQKECWKYTVKR